MTNLRPTILILATLLGSWLGMQAVHELGHVAGAWFSGAQVHRVVLYPLTLSRTDVGRNPHPLLVVWAGPIVGIALPLVCWLIAEALRFKWAFLPRFFAGFCCVANGLYIGIGSFASIGDCGEMLRNGSRLWQLWLFGALVAPCGLFLWHGQGKYFGLARDSDEISYHLAIASVLVCFGLLLFGVAVNGK